MNVNSRKQARLWPTLWALSFAVLVPTLAAHAAQVTATYVGPANGNYNVAANWSPAVVPDNGAGDDTYRVVIDSNGAQASSVTLNTTVSIDTLTVDTGDTLNIQDNRKLTVVNTGAGTGTIANSGTIALNSAGNVTDLIIQGDVTLSGAGTVTLSNATANRIYGTAVNDRLTVGSGQTIQGAGQIGVNQMALTNNGAILANFSNALTIDPSTSGASNNGTLRAAGGTLNLNGATFTNNATISAATASAVQLSGATISGGTLTTAGTGAIRNVGTSTLQNLTNAGAFAANDNTTTNLVGTINNTGTVAINSAGNVTNLVIQGDVTLSGGGTVTLSNATANRITGASITDRLTNSDNTIQGGGQIGGNKMLLTNNGTIRANVSNALTVDLSTSGINNGALTATGGATLLLQDSTITNNTIIDAQTGSQVNLASATIIGGTLTTAGTGVIRNVGTSTLQSLTNAGAFATNDNTITNLVGAIVNSGAIAITSAGNITDLVIQGDVTLNGGGTVMLSNATANRILGASITDRLTVGSGQTIQGAGQIGANKMLLTNGGTIRANVSNALTVDLSDSGINNGALTATGGGTLLLQNSEITNNATISAATASAVQLSGATIIGGTLTTAGTGVIRNVGTSTLQNLANAGAFAANDNTITNLVGAIVNSGTIALNSAGNVTSLVIQGDVTLSGGGTVTLSNATANRITGASATDRLTNSDNTIQGAGQIGNGAMALTNNGTILANVSNALAIDVAGANNFANTGTVQSNAGSTITVASGDILTQTSGLTLVNGALNFAGTGFADIQGGTLAGAGTVGGNVTNAGTVAPGAAATGNSTAILSISGSYTQTSAGTLAIQVGGPTLGTDFDSLRVIGTATFAGTLQASLINGFSPAIGTQFLVVPYASRTGTMTLNATSFSQTYNPTNLTLTVINTPPTLSNVSVSTNEDTAFTFSTAIFDAAFADINGDTLQSLRVASLPANGTLQLSGTGVTLNQVIARASLGNLTFAPALDFNGSTSFSYNASDGTDFAANNAQANITVVAVNDAPTISDVLDQTTNEDTATGAIAFTVGDVDNAPASLTVTRTSGNTTLVPNANIVFGGSGANRTVTITPAPDQNGTTTITITVSDGFLSVNDTFVLNVTAVNDPPTLNVIANRTISEDAGTQTVNLSGIAAGGGESQTLIITATSDNTALIPDPTVTYTSPDATGTLTFAPLANASGTATITVTISDGVTTTTRSFIVTVTAVNDAPTLADVSYNGTTGAAFSQQLSGQDVDGDTLTYSVTGGSLPAGLSLSSTGLISGTPTAVGTSTATVTAFDGTASGSGQITIVIAQGNRAPTLENGILSASANSAFSYPFVGRDADGDPLTYAVTGGALPFGLSLATDGTLSGNTAQTGVFGFTVTVNDGRGGTGAGSFNLTVNTMTDGVAPILTRNDILSTLTRDQLAALSLSGSVRDIAPTGVLPSGVRRVQIQLRRTSDGYAYNGSAFAPSLSPYYLATTGTSSDNAATLQYSRSLSFVPAQTVLTPGRYTLVLVALDNAGNYSGHLISFTIVAPAGNASKAKAPAGSIGFG